MTEGSAERLVRRVWAELARDPAELDALDPLPIAPLPARLDVSGLAVGSVAATSLVAAATSARHSRPSRVRVDGDRVAAAFTSERWYLQGGVRPEVWAPLSGFWRAANGWVRTHGNYPHHAAALRRVLGISEGADPGLVRDAVAGWSAEHLASDVMAAGGLCVAVRPEDPAIDRVLAGHPLVDVEQIGEASARRRCSTASDDAAAPLAGIRVLDLTRVIAGPVATRTLALLGADVLRIDPPEPAELPSQHLDTGAGKRSAILDVRRAEDASRFNMLLGRADVVVLGYRPASLKRLALDPESLVKWHPGLVFAQLSAWGFGRDESDRAGFDSLVQAASGIASIEGSLDRPGVLPAQALDHSTGYLLAAAVVSLLERQRREGGSWLARMSLRRTAAELLTMPRTPEPTPEGGLDESMVHDHLTSLDGEVEVRVARPAIAPGRPLDDWPAAPRPWGSDEPRWAS
jgi:hypothetical protein